MRIILFLLFPFFVSGQSFTFEHKQQHNALGNKITRNVVTVVQFIDNKLIIDSDTFNIKITHKLSQSTVFEGQVEGVFFIDKKEFYIKKPKFLKLF